MCTDLHDQRTDILFNTKVSYHTTPYQLNPATDDVNAGSHIFFSPVESSGGPLRTGRSPVLTQSCKLVIADEVAPIVESTIPNVNNLRHVQREDLGNVQSHIVDSSLLLRPNVVNFARRALMQDYVERFCYVTDVKVTPDGFPCRQRSLLQHAGEADDAKQGGNDQ